MTNSTINRIASAQKQGNPEDGSSHPFPNFPSSAHDPDALFLCKVLLENESSDTRAKKIPARTVPRARLRPSYMHKIKNKQGGRRKKSGERKSWRQLLRRKTLHQQANDTQHTESQKQGTIFKHNPSSPNQKMKKNKMGHRITVSRRTFSCVRWMRLPFYQCRCFFQSCSSGRFLLHAELSS